MSNEHDALWEELEADYRDNPLMKHITCEPDFRGGKPNIKEAGLTVSLILEMLANGWSFETIMEQYPRVTTDHIRAALLYAAWKMLPPGA